ncbi:MAG: DHHA1 domain-containing protein, partial [Plesiomonas sp.]
VKGKKLLVSLLKNGDAKALRTMVDDLKNQLGSGIVVLGLAQDDKVSLIAGVTKDLVGQVKAGELVSMLAAQVGGKGGGRPDMAQAGGSDAAALPAALDSVQAWVAERL